jgi:Uma2 family endonuclease
MSESMVRTRRWTRAEYDKLIDAGFFGPSDKIELLGGQLCVSEPQNSPHARGIWLGQEALQKALPPGWSVLAQLPIALDDESAPEPDLAVVSGRPRDYTDHPSRPALVVEIADSSLAFDRTHKGSLYARARLSEYWIVNLADRMLEVYRNPCPDNRALYGWAYSPMLTLGPGEHIVPLVAPSARILVADLLP